MVRSAEPCAQKHEAPRLRGASWVGRRGVDSAQRLPAHTRAPPSDHSDVASPGLVAGAHGELLQGSHGREGGRNMRRRGDVKTIMSTVAPGVQGGGADPREGCKLLKGNRYFARHSLCKTPARPSAPRDPAHRAAVRVDVVCARSQEIRGSARRCHDADPSVLSAGWRTGIERAGRKSSHAKRAGRAEPLRKKSLWCSSYNALGDATRALFATDSGLPGKAHLSDA